MEYLSDKKLTYYLNGFITTNEGELWKGRVFFGGFSRA